MPPGIPPRRPGPRKEFQALPFRIERINEEAEFLGFRGMLVAGDAVHARGQGLTVGFAGPTGTD